jgi:hypothetical protein
MKVQVGAVGVVVGAEVGAEVGAGAKAGVGAEPAVVARVLSGLAAEVDLPSTESPDMYPEVHQDRLLVLVLPNATHQRIR